MTEARLWKASVAVAMLVAVMLFAHLLKQHGLCGIGALVGFALALYRLLEYAARD